VGYSGGSASVYLYSSNSPQTINISGSTLKATGGGGGNYPGYGYISIYDDVSNINITNSTIQVDGGEGGIYLSAGGNLSVSGSSIAVNGGTTTWSGYSYINLYGNTVGIDSSTLRVTGSNATTDFGGGAEVYAYAYGVGGLGVNGSTLEATGGTGPLRQGYALVSLGSGTFGGNVNINSSTLKATGFGASIYVDSAANVTAVNSALTAAAKTGADGGEGSISVYAPSGSIDTTGSTLSAIGRSSLDGGPCCVYTGTSLYANGNVTLGQLTSSEFVGVQSNSGAIIDGNAGANVVAPAAVLTGFNGVGSITNPLETQVGDLVVAANTGEIGIINAGDLRLLDLFYNGGGSAAIGTTGNLKLLSPIDQVSGNLTLAANNGMLIDQPILISGDLTLNAGAGDLGISGVDVFANNIALAGNNIHVGFTTATLPTSVIANNLVTGVSAGNFNVLGGANSSANALLQGMDVDLTVGTTSGFLNLASGIDGASAQIHSVSPSTITLTFPTLASGGFFVNGVEGALNDGASTGFFADGAPAVLGENLLVTYGGVATLPPALDQAVNQVINATNLQTEIVNETPGEDKEPTTANSEEQKIVESDNDKKALPVCK